VRRKEVGHIIVKTRQSTRAETLCVGCEVQLAAEDARFQLHSAIAAIAETLQNRPQVDEKEHRNARITRQLLFQAEVCGVFAEFALLEEFVEALRSFYLAGGTGLALYLGHRRGHLGGERGATAACASHPTDALPGVAVVRRQLNFHHGFEFVSLTDGERLSVRPFRNQAVMS